MKPADKIKTFSYSVFRIFRLAILTLTFGFKFFVLRLFFRAKGAVYLRSYIEKCGGLFLKVGQLLAVRLDLIPQEYEVELRELLAQRTVRNVKPEPFNYVKETIESELGKKLDDVFEIDSFDPDAEAWASVAQVHKAKLKGSEEWVAVKVMRTGVKEKILTDLLFLKVLSAMLQSVGLFRSYGLRAMTCELTRLTEKEVNFIDEAVYLEEMRSLMINDDVNHYAPRVYTEYSRERVMVMEYLEGVWVSDLLETVESSRNGDSDAKEKLEEWRMEGVTPEETARLMFRSLIEQSCRYRLFHADPHPGNLIVRKGDGALQYVDFGIVGHLDEFAWEKLQDLFRAMGNHDSHGTYEALIRTVEPLPPIDTKSMESEIKRAVADWMTASKSQSGRMEEKSNGKLLLRAVDAMRRNRIQFPWAVMALFRATIVSDISVYRLDPKFDTTVELRDFFAKIQRKQIVNLLDLCVWQRKAYELINSVSSISETVTEVSSWSRTRLPRVGRSYGQKMTRMEQGVSRALRDLGGIIFVGGLTIGVIKVAEQLNVFPITGNILTGTFWSPASVICLVFGFLLVRTARRIEDPI